MTTGSVNLMKRKSGGGRNSLVDGDLGVSAGSSVKSGDLQQTVGINLESATVKHQRKG